jgi:hypothetical protein
MVQNCDSQCLCSHSNHALTHPCLIAGRPFTGPRHSVRELAFYLIFLVGICIFLGTFAAAILLSSASEGMSAHGPCGGNFWQQLHRGVQPSYAVPAQSTVVHEERSLELEASVPLPHLPALHGVVCFPALTYQRREGNRNPQSSTMPHLYQAVKTSAE